MIYSKRTAMEKNLYSLRPVLVIGIGLMLAFTSAVLSRSLPVGSNHSVSALSIQPTVTPSAQDVSEIGSTDGIVFMGFLILLIIWIPILIYRRSWLHS